MIKNTLFILLVLILWSCKKESKTTEPNEKIATVIVNIKNAENQNFVLSILGEDFENRLSSQVKNEQLIFEVPYAYSDLAWIESQYNLDSVQNIRNIIPVLLENDTISITANFLKDSIQYTETEFYPYYTFKNIDFKKGAKNITLETATDQLYALNEGIIYSNDVLDSLNRTVFPKIRKEGLALFTNEFRDFDTRIKAELFSTMLDFFSFSPEYLNEDETNEINRLYGDLSTIKESYAYRFKMIEDQISRINEYGNEQQLSFTDFNLIDDENQKVSLRQVANKNKYTVLYFWFSGCGPCRNFNKKMNKDLTEQLTEKGIEVVSISTDFDKTRWENATATDSIFWRNFYGGNIKDDIEIAYKIQAYPTKVIVDSDLKVIDFKFINPNDLLALEHLADKK
ncbi:MAG: TlpA disulfide reductase family protein [Bacteroidota bacterium]